MSLFLYKTLTNTVHNTVSEPEIGNIIPLIEPNAFYLYCCQDMKTSRRFTKFEPPQLLYWFYLRSQFATKASDFIFFSVEFW